MGRAGRGKGHDRIGPRHRAHLFAHNIRVGAGRNIHRDHRSRARIHCGDGFSVEPAHGGTEAGAEDGVNQNIRIKDRAGCFSLHLVVFRHPNRRHGQPGEHFRGIAAQLGALRQQQYANVSARFMQFAGRDKSVAAVISLSANYSDRFSRGILRQDKRRHGRARVLHEGQRRNAEALAGGAVDLAHFGSCDDFHDRAVAMRSNWRSWEDSPMAIR